MKFYAFGLNHVRAPIKVREAFALEGEAIRGLYRSLSLSAESEIILLSTCNRTEAFLFGTQADIPAVRDALTRTVGATWPDAHDFVCQDEEAVRHVLELAAGLRSLVLGDAQIFSQLKEAYRVAVEEQRVGTTMHRLMHTAFRAAKRVINETDLTTGAASVPHQAVAVAQAHFLSRNGRNISDLSALVVGAGTMAGLAAEALQLAGIQDLAVTNRSEERGREMARRYQADFVGWGRRHEVCRARDVVIVATASPVPIISAEELEKTSGEGGTLFIDISVPRNVDPGISELPHTTVVDLDTLNESLVDSESQRRSAVPKARLIVDEMLGEFVAWVFHKQALDPAIQTIADTFESIRRQEVERHHARFGEIDREELDRITRSIIQKILAVPIVRLKGVQPESIDFDHSVQLLHALFHRDTCDDSAEAGGDAINSQAVMGAGESSEIALDEAGPVLSSGREETRRENGHLHPEPFALPDPNLGATLSKSEQSLENILRGGGRQSPSASQ